MTGRKFGKQLTNNNVAVKCQLARSALEGSLSYLLQLFIVYSYSLHFALYFATNSSSKSSAHVFLATIFLFKVLQKTLPGKQETVPAVDLPS